MNEKNGMLLIEDTNEYVAASVKGKGGWGGDLPIAKYYFLEGELEITPDAINYPQQLALFLQSLALADK